MKSILLCAAAVLGTHAAIAQTTYPGGIPGCIARWDFSGQPTAVNALDVSNNNHSGVSNNVVSGSGWRNKPHSAAYFNGTSSNIVVPHHPQLNPQNITIVAMVNFESFPNVQCQSSNIVYKSVTYHSGNWAMNVTDQFYDNNCNTYSPTKMQLDMPFSTTGYTLPPQNYLETGKWYFMATTYDGSSVKRYQIAMDQTTKQASIQPIATTNMPSALNSSTDNVVIGSTQNPSYMNYVHGAMEEVALFNTALSDGQIYQIYEHLWGQGLSIAKQDADKLLSVRTNDGMLTVQNAAQNSNVELSITNALGQKLMTASQTTEVAAYDLSAWRNQVIFVEYRINGITGAKKVFMQ